jgi:hypothetical protein
MAAPKGNDFWKLRAKSGRDKIFSSPEVFLEEAYNYFDSCNENPWFKNEAIKSGDMAGVIINIPTQRPYTLQGLCVFLNIDTQTFRNYETNEIYKDFFGVFRHIHEIIECNQLEGATVGCYNANIIGRLLGLAETVNTTSNVKQEIVVSTPETKQALEDLKNKFENE